MQLADRIVKSVSNINQRPEGLVSKYWRLRNQGVSFHQLPNELPTRVFFFTVQEVRQSHINRLRELAQVSSKLLQLIKGTPSLFGYITVDNTIEDARHALPLSKDSPLDVKYYDDRVGGAKLSSVNRILRQPAPRIQDLRIVDSAPQRDDIARFVYSKPIATPDLEAGCGAMGPQQPKRSQSPGDDNDQQRSIPVTAAGYVLCVAGAAHSPHQIHK
ncbi:hypothetical protein FRB98_003094 [Tulasnella sp. 332]|nr:hypothetical protein FRB98_003094 [Tulasnella sp. 332]